MKIAAAQLRPVAGDIEYNLQQHLRFIELARQHNINLLLFSELSLTGYEPKLAESLAKEVDDHCLDPLQLAANNAEMIVLAGMPTLTPDGIEIGLPVFLPGNVRDYYAKRQLHEDEFPFFVDGKTFRSIRVGQNLAVPAICYESMLMENAREAKRNGAQIYLASVAKDQAGVDRGLAHYAHVAEQLSMTVLVANCVGPCDNFTAFGHSAIWQPSGRLIANLDDIQQGLVVYDVNTQEASTVLL